MRIAYLIAGTYRSGGMERVLANKANWLVRHGVAQILIVTTDQCGRKPFFELDERIGCTDLAIGYESNNGHSFIDKLIHYPILQIRHFRKLSALLKNERVDVVVSMFCNDASFLPFIKDGSRKILEIHFSRFKRLQYGRTGLWAWADRLRSRNDKRIASRFEKFVVLTNEDRGYWESDSTMRNICVIPNARTFAPLDNSPMANNGKTTYTVLAVGRYNEQKAFNVLINVWRKIMDNRPAAEYCKDWRLRIVGDGELRGELQQQIDSLGLGDSVELGQPQSDLRPVYADSDIYAMTSLYEGLPMVLLEAQASGLPIVAMTCKCGPRDVVTDGVDGFLVPEGNVGVMAERLMLLMSDSVLRKRMAGAARLASDRYDEEFIMKKWVRLFEEQ